MKKIDSISNPKILEVRKILARKDRGYFVLEGRKLIEEAVQSGVALKEVFVTTEAWNRERAWLLRMERKGVELFGISSAMARRISELETPPGIAGIARRPERTVSSLLTRYGAFLVSVRDPGNFGMILRSAEAAGCQFVAYTKDCVDPYLSKVIRASSGSVFRVPLIEVSELYPFLNEHKNRGTKVYGLDPHSGKLIFRIQPVTPALILVGSESKGLPKDIPFEEVISIPMMAPVESLNTAVAASLCFYWFSYHMPSSPWEE